MLCVGCTTQFNANDLVYSQKHLYKIIEAAQKQIDILVTKTDPVSMELVQGFYAIVKDSSDSLDEVITEVMNQEVKLAYKNGMTKEEWMEASAKQFDLQKCTT
jgi:hypothetical protein